MKAFKRELRKITVSDTVFTWVITESSEHVKLRCYNIKSTYIDLYMNWKDWWGVSINKPVVVAEIIKYAISRGWQYKEEKQTMVFGVTDTEDMIQKLGLDKL